MLDLIEITNYNFISTIKKFMRENVAIMNYKLKEKSL